MASKIKLGKQKSKPITILIGIGTSLVTTLISAAVIAYLVSIERLGQAGMGAAVLSVLAISSALGAFVSSSILKENRIPICVITTAGYYGILLLCNVFIFGGEFHGFWKSLLMVLIGTAVVMLPVVHKKSGKRKYKIPVYR